jgi:hypothetical protein
MKKTVCEEKSEKEKEKKRREVDMFEKLIPSIVVLHLRICSTCIELQCRVWMFVY